MPSILFVCTANQFRSPIAAACLQRLIDREQAVGGWIVESAGTWTEAGISPPTETLRIARQLGLDGLYRHRTRQIDPVLLDQYDLIIVMEIGHKEAIAHEFPAVQRRLYLLSEIANGFAYDVPDPGNSDADPNEVGWEIQHLISKGKGKIFELAESLSKSRKS